MSKKNKLIKNKSRANKKQPADSAPHYNSASVKPSVFDKIIRPHIFFPILAGIFGSLFIITTPPFQVPDEIAHFDRAYKLAEFGTFQKIENNQSGDYIPQSIDSTLWLFRYLSWKPDEKVDKQQIIDAFKIPLREDKRKFVNIDAGPYFYFSYIPQYPAIYLGKLFDLNVLTILYLGRFLGLLFYILCVRYAIRQIPVAKILFTVITLLPICLAQAGSSNADCVLFSFSFIAVALLLKLSVSKERIRFNNETILLLFILLIIGVLKIVYLPIAVLIFLLPRLIFKTKLSYITITVSIILSSAFFAIAWYKLNPLSSGPSNPDANTSGKIESLISNPFISFKILWQTLSLSYESYYKTMIGVLGYLDTVLRQGVYTVYGLLILFLILFEYNNQQLIIKKRALLFLISAGVMAAIILSLYLINHRDNGFIVTGVQGRYFIPILFPLLLAFYGLLPYGINFSKNKFATVIVLIILTGLLTSTEFTLIERYFG